MPGGQTNPGTCTASGDTIQSNSREGDIGGSKGTPHRDSSRTFRYAGGTSEGVDIVGNTV